MTLFLKVALINLIDNPQYIEKLGSGNSESACERLVFTYVVRTKEGLADHLVQFFPNYVSRDVNKFCALK